MSEPAVSFREVARRWLVANAVSIFALSVNGWISFAMYALWDVGHAEPGSAQRIAYATVAAALSVIWSAIFARLTGPVLRLVVPALSQHKWLIANLAIGLASALGDIVWVYQRSSADLRSWTDLGAGKLVSFLVAVVLVGGFLGLLAGAAQVLALKSAAVGVRTWRLMSAASGSLTGLTILAGIALLPNATPVANEVGTQVIGAIAEGISAIVMLPALRRLEPRGYG